MASGELAKNRVKLQSVIPKGLYKKIQLLARKEGVSVSKLAGLILEVGFQRVSSLLRNRDGYFRFMAEQEHLSQEESKALKNAPLPGQLSLLTEIDDWMEESQRQRPELE